MPEIFTATGSKVYIAPSQTTTPANAAAYAALTWTEVKFLESIGEYGDSSSIITAAVIGDGRMRKAKGARDAGEMQLVMFMQAPTDPGQQAMIAAEGTYNIYPIKVELPNKLTAGGTNELNYMMALVTSKRKNVGGNDNVVRDTFNLAVNSAITITDATGV
jgi:hypothetical protein